MLTDLSDTALSETLLSLAAAGRGTTVELIRHLAEFEARRLHLAAGYPSLFAYCLDVLHLSEAETCNRIEAARAALRFPVILDGLRDGRLSLTTVRLLAPHLTSENHSELLDSGAHARKRDVEALIARHFPRPDIATSIRRVAQAPSPEPHQLLGTPTEPLRRSASPLSPAPPPPPRRPAKVAPLSEARCEFRFTAPARARDRLQQAQDLLRHAIASGDVGEIFDRALGLLIDDALCTKAAKVPVPRPGRTSKPGSRCIPAQVRREVWRRDECRCAFVGNGGRRCSSTAFLEFHHVKPFGIDGPSTAGNIELRCRAHNAYEAVLLYGPMRAAASSA